MSQGFQIEMNKDNRPRRSVNTWGMDDASLQALFTPPMVNTQVDKSSGAIPKKIPKADDQDLMTENFSVTQLEVSRLDSTTEGIGEKVEKEHLTCSQLAVPSLPAANKNAVKDAAKGNIGQKHSPVDLVAKKIKNERAGHCQQSNPPSRPVSLEAACTWQNPSRLVTGHLNIPWQNSSDSDESGSPTEHEDHLAKIQLSKDLKQECKRLVKMYISKDREPERKRLAEGIRQRDRGDEQHDKTDVGLESLQEKETSEMCFLKGLEHGKLAEMYISKEHDCKILNELVRKQDQRCVNANFHMETLKREKMEKAKELRSVNEQLEKLQDKHKQQRLDFDRRMAEASEECHNAQLEKVKMNTKLAKEISKGKRVKRQLERERSKRKQISRKLAGEKSKVTRMEKRNKKVCKELRKKTTELNNSMTENKPINQCYHKSDDTVQEMEALQREYQEVSEELTVRTSELESCQAQYIRLQRELEEFRDRILAELRVYKTTSEEWKSRLVECMGMLAASDGMCRNLSEMYQAKQAECDDLEAENISLHRNLLHTVKELNSVIQQNEQLESEKEEGMKVITQQNQKYRHAIGETEALKKERQELSEKLDKASGQVEELGLELQEERRRRKMDLEKLLAIDKRKGKRMWPREVKEEGGGGGEEWEEEEGGTYRSQEEQNDVEVNSIWPRKAKGGGGGGGGGGEEWEGEEDGEGGTYGSQESENDDTLKNTWPRNEQEGGEGGGEEEEEELEGQGREAHNDGALNSTASSEEKAD